MDTLRLEGKVAIITGAASGIGEATARLFAMHGAFVVIADIQDELGAQVVASIGEEKASYMHCDVQDENDVAQTVAHAVNKYGAVDVMFANAGIHGPNHSFLEMESKEINETLAINVVGCAFAIKHAARAMVEKTTRGSIICTASTESMHAGGASAAYVASKHAVAGLVKAAARDLGKYGIRVNCVSPHGLATRLSCASMEMEAAGVEAWFAAHGNLKGAVLTAADVATAALFLASDESGFVSGSNLVVDGGISALMAPLITYN